MENWDGLKKTVPAETGFVLYPEQSGRVKRKSLSYDNLKKFD